LLALQLQSSTTTDDLRRENVHSLGRVR